MKYDKLEHKPVGPRAEFGFNEAGGKKTLLSAVRQTLDLDACPGFGPCPSCPAASYEIALCLLFPSKMKITPFSTCELREVKHGKHLAQCLVPHQQQPLFNTSSCPSSTGTKKASELVPPLHGQPGEGSAEQGRSALYQPVVPAVWLTICRDLDTGEEPTKKKTRSWGGEREWVTI